MDVGDELGTAAQDLPTQMRNVYDDNRRRNTYPGGGGQNQYYDDGSAYDY